jgi:hypothetical protein
MPNPYSEEIESFDDKVEDFVEKLYKGKNGEIDQVVPQMYKTSEETEFLFVDN